jgi:hypothetical protein
MNTVRFLFILFVSVLVAGCGSGYSGPSGTGGNTPQNIQGAWEIAATSTTLAGTQTFIEADLTQSGNNVSARGQQLLTLTVTNGTGNVDICSTQPSLSGNLNGSVLTATLTEGSQSVRISGTLSADGKSATGNYQSDAGGCTMGDSGTFTANLVSMLSGSFSGTLTNQSTTNSAPATLQLTQGANETLTGSGQITDQGVTYTLSFTGSVIGALFEGTGTSTSVNGSTQIDVLGHFTPSATAVDGFVVGDANSQSILYEGTLSKTGSGAAVPAFRFSLPFR